MSDAYGHIIWDWYKGKKSFEIIERDDGYFDVGCPEIYFADYKHWPAHERAAMKYVQGRVVDIGCGAGRHALWLQKQGFEVLGIDSSRLAIKVCKLRGLKRTKCVSITQFKPKTSFDTALMLGANFGLFASARRARWLLKRFRNFITKRIIAETRDPYATKTKEHLAYHKYNLARGRMAGQVRMRIRYKKYKSAWFDYLFVSKSEMKTLLKGTGWAVKKFLDGNGMYIAIIDRCKYV